MRRTYKNELQRKKRTEIIFWIIIVGICVLCSFLLGQAVGEKEVRDELHILVMKDEKADVKEEMEGTNPKIPKKDILLVNKDNPLPEDYEVELVTFQDGVNRAAKDAYQPLSDMLKAGIKEGLTFEICSSYRDVSRQKELFEEDVAALMQQGYSYQEAYKEVAKETMPPGCSEHSTGLAFDIVAFDYQMLDEKQAMTDENIWLREHCAEYGFILRYPKGKEDITGISYESWHFRYVGVEVAKYIMENEITLEEYLAESKVL